MKINFTTINKKDCTTDLQKKLWNGAEEFAKTNVMKKLESAAKYLGDLQISIIIDMGKGIPSVIQNDLTEEQFITAQRALHAKL